MPGTDGRCAHGAVRPVTERAPPTCLVEAVSLEVARVRKISFCGDISVTWGWIHEANALLVLRWYIKLLMAPSSTP
jgi:hypothetical protein